MTETYNIESPSANYNQSYYSGNMQHNSSSYQMPCYPFYNTGYSGYTDYNYYDQQATVPPMSYYSDYGYQNDFSYQQYNTTNYQSGNLGCENLSTNSTDSYTSVCSPDTGIVMTSSNNKSTTSNESSSSISSASSTSSSNGSKKIAPKKSSPLHVPIAKSVVHSQQPIQSSRPVDTSKIQVQLSNKSLWDKFNGHQTEMIITKQGRYVS